MGKNSRQGGVSVQIFFLVLLLAVFGMLWVITKQGRIIMELNHEINMLKLEINGNEALDVVTFALKKTEKKVKR